MKKKVVHITTVHNAKDSRIFFRECASLAKHYQTLIIAPGEENEIVDNIEMKYLGHSNSRLNRISSYQFKALKLALSQKADLYHFHDPELILTGIVLKILGYKVIYDVHEDVPKDILLKRHIPSLFKKPLAFLAKCCEKFAGYLFDHIITVTPDIAKKFPSKKVSIVRNYPFLPDYIFNLMQYKKRTNDLIYIGSINESRGLNEMALATSDLNCSLTLIGNMSKELQESLLRNSPKNTIQYISWMPSPKLSCFLNNSKIGLILLHPTPTFLTSYPLKMFEYMAAGLPIIASNFPDWRAIVEKYECGLIVDPQDTKAIIKAISYLLNNPEKAFQMGQNGMAAIKHSLNWERESQSLLKTYDGLLEPSPY